MTYRSDLQHAKNKPFPILGKIQQSTPFLLDLSKHTQLSVEMLNDQVALQKYIKETFYPKYKWGIATYLEYRPLLLNRFPQMATENRYFHLGIDVIAPIHKELFAPISGKVFYVGYEEGEGNYGGLVVLQHTTNDDKYFYSLYGHLDKDALPLEGDNIEGGSVFARMGDMTCNGHWFFHTHVQLLTQKAIDDGWMFRGYCTKEQCASMNEYCPSPFLFIGVENEAFL
ncbi:MAG: peptidoglycan DD-metalloendopeptidase family protein [Candidatus Peribacteraceae bacterium]|nr:peptidoglycan DD-metalloendopeptidase family protein [Candidatus Peribacteraceae bacterium]